MKTADQLDHRAAVAAEAARFVDLVRGADMTAPVPTCPGWDLTDLTRHAGSVHRWFSVLLRQRIQAPPAGRDVDLRLPERADGYADWLAEGAAEAAEVFAGTDLDAPMWVWGADGHARFWVRRMAFETLVHRVDAERALGLPSAVDRTLAHDGVDEFLVNLPYAALFAPKVAGLRAADRTIRFECTDTDGSWLVRLRPDGFGVVADGAAEGGAGGVAADAVVRAPAADLLLLLYGRLDRSAATVEAGGDGELLDLWFANSEF
ncbi:maleylpyruvate isomerase family mycothiol-dependent enzyme [Streptomyces katrae]|uniref:maleylpyruvate isomerase family mycothiol-dependent enzyme n=1 Tax=Streptomyces katrae TaxID=68223 RepID=UPI0009A54848|nr:maleylpyruvate isomerase family mycothiol-dependent enzyme [Streptomyces katrae]